MKACAQKFLVVEVSWADAQNELAALRRQVFVDEQGVPENLEWDGRDGDSRHVLVRDESGRALGCGRLLPEGRIGRMAVARKARGHGVGRIILQRLVELARRRGQTELLLDAQCYAIGFYEKEGFVAEGPIFDDAGIPHRRMRASYAESGFSSCASEG